MEEESLKKHLNEQNDERGDINTNNNDKNQKISKMSI